MQKPANIKLHNNRNSLMFIFEGIMIIVIQNIANPFFSMFGKRLGAGDYEIGLLSSLPALIGVLAVIPGALISQKYSNKKKMIIMFILSAGIMYPLAALTPYTGGKHVYLYILTVSLINLPISIYTILWQSYFSDVIPTDRRNNTYARRSKFSNLFGMTSLTLSGFILAYIPGNNSQRITIYQIFFFTAFILAMLQAWFMSRVVYTSPPLPKTRIKPLLQLKESIKIIRNNKPFKSFILTAFIFHVTWQMAWPLFFIYQVNFLNANEAWIGYLNVGTGLAGVLTYMIWSRMIEKKGAKFVIIIGAFGLALNPLLLVMSKTLLMALVCSISVGLVFSAFQLALFENLMDTVPQQNKTLNIAIYATFINLSNFISPMIGVWIYKHSSIFFAMTLTCILRLVATFLFYIQYRKSINKQSS